MGKENEIGIWEGGKIKSELTELAIYQMGMKYHGFRIVQKNN